MKIFTIGFTRKSAQTFFTRLREAGVQRVVDVRLNNVSQLAGFAKRDDLRFFLETICAIDYAHEPGLAPTQELLDSYRRTRRWPEYEARFLELLAQRRVEDLLPRERLDRACLLCSEDGAQHCHRRLVAEYLQRQWADAAPAIVHL